MEDAMIAKVRNHEDAEKKPQQPCMFVASAVNLVVLLLFALALQQRQIIVSLLPIMCILTRRCSEKMLRQHPRTPRVVPGVVKEGKSL